MKRIGWIVFGAFLVISTGVAASPANAQSGTPVPPTPAANGPSTDALMAEAQHAIDEADRVSTQAGLVINFIQVVAIAGGALATLVGLGLGVTGLRTLSEYRDDLSKAHEELDEMRSQLLAATEQASQARQNLETSNAQQIQNLREQAANAYRALALLQLGEQQFELGNIRAALRIHEEAYQLDPDNRATNYLLGELYILERDVPRAVEHLEKALAQDPNLAPAHAALGYGRRLQADATSDPIKRNQMYAEAEQRLLRAVQIDPSVRDANKESVYSTLGGLYRRQGRLDEAIRYYGLAEKITPNSSYPLVNLAQLHFMRGDVEEAKTYFKRVILVSLKKLDSNPFDYWARFDVVTARLALGESAEAFNQLNQAFEQVQGAGPLETLLSGLHNLKNAPHPPPDIDKAISAVEDAVRKRQTRVAAT